MRALSLAVLLLAACGPPEPEALSRDAGAEDDAGVVAGVAPPSNDSHYSWSQGCGCSSGGDGMGVIVLALLLVSRSRRARAAALTAALLVAQPASAEQPKPEPSSAAEDARTRGELVPEPEARPSTHQWTVGLRVELEALGILDRQPAIAPAIFASWGRGLWGAAVAVIVLPTVGVRAEGRLHLLETSRVRPLFGIGATLFGTAFAPRGVLGVTADVGPVRLSLDAAIEYFVSGPLRFEPLAILSSFGVAWRF